MSESEEKCMKYSINVNEVRSKEGSNIKGFATVVFGDSFKITNIAILENKEKGQLFVSMPRYRSNERDENNGVVYKDVCNPITAEFREELYGNILEAYEKVIAHEQEETRKQEGTEMPDFSVTVTPYEREGSNIKGLARIYFENSFIVNNVNILQGKENIFVSMPSYKTKQVDEKGKAVYQDVCYPVTKEFREKLYDEIIREYEKAKEKSNDRAKDNAARTSGSPEKKQERDATPFR
jgi:DNA-binding cell septation regulator SpoVG